MVQLSVMDSTPRVRVNGGMLAQYSGQPVCVLGTVVKADGGGSAFQMKASDGAIIVVRLKSPISNPLTGLVEVYGVAQAKGVASASITTFPDEIASTFDLNTYNETLKIIHSSPNNPWLIQN